MNHKVIDHSKIKNKKPLIIHTVNVESKKIYSQKDCERLAISYSGIFFDTSKNIIGGKYRFRCSNNHIFESDPEDIRNRKYFCTTCYSIGQSGEIITDNIMISALSIVFGKSINNLYVSSNISIYSVDNVLCLLEGINYKNSVSNVDVNTILKKYSHYKIISIPRKTILNDLVNNIIVQLDNKKNNTIDFVDHYTGLLLKNLGEFDVRHYVLIFMRKVLYTQATKVVKNGQMTILPEFGIGWNVRKHDSFKSNYEIVNKIPCINISTSIMKQDLLKYIIETIRIMIPDLNKIIGDDTDKFVKVSMDYIDKL